MKLGVIIRLREDTDLEAKFKEAHEMGFESVQLTCWQMDRYTDGVAETIKGAMEKYNVRISTFWCGWRGKESWMWNSYEGPLTLGIVPPHARFERILDLKKGSDFAKKARILQRSSVWIKLRRTQDLFPRTPTTSATARRSWLCVRLPLIAVKRRLI